MRNLHGVRRLPSGLLRVRLSEAEHALLSTLPEQLRPLLTGEATPDEVRARLFPRVYEDPLEELEHRPVGDEERASERLLAIDLFARTLASGKVGRLGWSVELTGEEAGAWLSAVNDARLVLGVVLGITTESQWEDDLDPGDPTGAALWYLGWLEEQLVQALMATLDDGDGADPPAPTIG